MSPSPTDVWVVMGVTGSGKSTVATRLAAALGVAFQEGDDLHPQANIAKMHAGHPLDDGDRRQWLEAVRHWIDAQRTRRAGGVVTCSALRRSYREHLVHERPEVRFLYLRGSPATLAERLRHRQGHFMPAALLQSQLDTLEVPGADEPAFTVDIDGQDPDAVVARSLALLQKRDADPVMPPPRIREGRS